MKNLLPLQPYTLCADDFAMTQGVSRGILLLAQQKRIHATSCMTNREYWPEWSQYLKPLRPQLRLGVHLNFTLGSSLSTPTGLVREGRFLPLSSVLFYSMLGQLPYDQIRAEIAAQFDAFVRSMQTPPDFIDGHQHVHVLPTIRKALLDECVSRGWQGCVWLRDPSDRIRSIFKRKLAIPKAIFVKILAHRFASQAHKKGFDTNIGFSGFRSFDDTSCFADELKAFQINMGARHVMMCHPGEIDEELEMLGELTSTRLQELKVLLSESLLSDQIHSD